MYCCEKLRPKAHSNWSCQLVAPGHRTQTSKFFSLSESRDPGMTTNLMVHQLGLMEIITSKLFSLPLKNKPSPFRNVVEPRSCENCECHFGFWGFYELGTMCKCRGWYTMFIYPSYVFCLVIIFINTSSRKWAKKKISRETCPHPKFECQLFARSWMHLDIFSHKKKGTLAMKNKKILHRLDARSVQFAWLGPVIFFERKKRGWIEPELYHRKLNRIDYNI